MPTYSFIVNGETTTVEAPADLAMLWVLQAAFVTAFGSRFTLGALVTFVVTVADTTVMNISGAFWGLVVGVAVSRLLERQDVHEPPSAG